MNLLAPFGKIYGRVMDLRNRLYDRGTLKTFHLGARTISVGNLTTGGTGKTPLVALIADILIRQGETVCILTRGYGRQDAGKRVLVSDGDSVLAGAVQGGDEPVELAHRLDGKAVIISDRDRVAAAEWALQRFAITTFILDDGFQHRRARRDLDIVCIDATDPCGGGRILPAGNLREPFSGLRRADAIVITRSDQVGSSGEIEQRLRSRNPEAPIFKARTAIRGLVPIEHFPSAPFDETAGGRDLLAFTGIGNARNFFRALEMTDVRLVARKKFADHHTYAASDLRAIERLATDAGADALVTTAKDAVKLLNSKIALPCFVAVAEMVLDAPPAFEDLVLGKRDF